MNNATAQTTKKPKFQRLGCCENTGIMGFLKRRNDIGPNWEKCFRAIIIWKLALLCLLELWREDRQLEVCVREHVRALLFSAPKTEMSLPGFFSPLKFHPWAHKFFILGVRTLKKKNATVEDLCASQLCGNSGEEEQETEGVRTNSSERGKEVRVMSNRGEETKREDAWKRRKKKKNKNIFRPTHWASGWETKQLQPCGGIRRESSYCALVRWGWFGDKFHPLTLNHNKVKCKPRTSLKTGENDWKIRGDGEVNDLRDVSGSPSSLLSFGGLWTMCDP